MIVKDIVFSDLKVSTSSDDYKTGFRGPITIQPVPTNVCGTPKYTLEVSNDGEHFHPYDDSSTNVKITQPIQINYNPFPWQFIRITTVCSPGDSGSVIFKVGLHER